MAVGISIHAAREGGDALRHLMKDLAGISIHAAREGGDTVAGQVPADYTLFQSTPPVKAATTLAGAYIDELSISIHAAREGGDCGNE